MNKKNYTLNIILAVVLGAVLLVGILVRAFAPGIILPAADVPKLVLLSLLALLAERRIAPGTRRRYIPIALLSALTFGLLPLAAYFAGVEDAMRLAVLGGAVFPAATWLFDSMTDRLSTGPAAKAAPVISALGLYLAAQCMMGIQ